MPLRKVHTAFNLLETDGTKKFFPLGVRQFTEEELTGPLGSYISGFTDKPDLDTAEPDAADYEEAVNRIVSLKNQMAEKDSTIVGLDAELSGAKTAIRSLTDQLTSNKTVIEGLNAQIADLKTELAGAQAHVNALTNGVVDNGGTEGQGTKTNADGDKGAPEGDAGAENTDSTDTASDNTDPAKRGPGRPPKVQSDI